MTAARKEATLRSIAFVAFVGFILYFFYKLIDKAPEECRELLSSLTQFIPRVENDGQNKFRLWLYTLTASYVFFLLLLVFR